MKVTICLFAICLLTALGLQSCSRDHSMVNSTLSNDPGPGSEWTVLFYGTDNYSSEGNGSVMEAVTQLQNAHLMQGIHVVACISSPQTDGHARVYRMATSGNAEGGIAGETSFMDWGSRDLSSAQTLSSFIELALTESPAERYALILAGDGQGWQGGLTDNINGNGQPMTPTDMRAAITSLSVAGNPVHFNVVAWFAPEMSGLETAYECRAFSDYMVACPYAIRHDFALSVRYWMFDLNGIPEIDGERFATVLVDGMMEGLQQESTPHQYSVLRLARVAAAAFELDSLAAALTPHVTDYAPQIQALRDSSWVSQTDDSQAVDLGRMAVSAQRDSLLSQEAAIAEAAEHLTLALNELVIYRRSNQPADDRLGVTLYFPATADTTLLTTYNALSLPSTHPQWPTFLRTLGTSAPVQTVIQGTVRWSGHPLENIHLFLNTNQVGAANIALTNAATLSDSVGQDQASYTSTSRLEADSIACYIGLFLDFDHDGALTTGDRYGYYHSSSPLRDWIVLRSGDQLENINVQLTATF